jgi:hypothetical protein
MTATIDLNAITLSEGAHAPDSGQGCALEWVSVLAGEPWSDHPKCTSPVIAAFVRRWSDDLPDNASRDRLLKPLLPLLLNTATGASDDEVRAWLVTDWLVRTHTPAWFDLVPALSEAGQALRNLPALTNAAAARKAQPTIDRAGDAAWGAARGAARGAAGGAARGAAGDAAWGAARGAARDAAGDAAWGAARGAARDAAGDAAWGAARGAAGDAAWGAARGAARDAAGDAAGDAAWGAAKKALHPTVEQLQASAVELIRALCAVGRVGGATP